MKTKTPNNTTCFRRLKAGLIMAALLPATAGLLQAQTTSAYTNLTANLQWGNGINWSPNGIPNGTDAVVNLNGTTLYCSNTVENIALSNNITGPNYPFVFGTLNIAGTVGANTAGNQLRAAVSTGVPVINGNGIIYTRLSGSQGIIYQNANAFTVGGLAGNGYLVLSNTTSPGVPITLTVGGNHASATYFGRLPGIASGGTLVKVGAGTLTPSGTADNSYVALNVSNGVVVLGKTSTGSVHAIGGGITLNGGTVQLNGVGIDQINNASLVTLNSRDYILPKILQGNSGIMRFTKRAADFYPQIASRGFALFRIR